MSGTQTDVGILPQHHAKYDEFGKPSTDQYNRGHGRKPAAPLGGGDRQEAYDKLLTKGKAVD